MNSKPRRSSFGPTEQIELLDAMGAARDRVTRLSAAIPPNGERYSLCRVVMKAIDDLAGELTGDRTSFHAKPHGGCPDRTTADEKVNGSRFRVAVLRAPFYRTARTL